MANRKPLSPSQIVKLQEMFGASLRKANPFSDEAGDLIENRWDELKDELEVMSIAAINCVLERMRNTIVVEVDYDAPNAIATAISDGNFGGKYLGLKPDEIPLFGSGQATPEVKEVCLGRRALTSEVLAHLDENGYKFADPLTALRYAIELPDRQCQNPMAIVFKVYNQLWCLVLSDGSEGRHLGVHLDNHKHTGDEWGGYYGFLAVSKW